MSIDMPNGKVRAYNYELSPVGFPSQNLQQGVFIRGRSEDEESVVERVSFDDIEVENSKSDLFKVGRIRFHPEEQEEIYKKLNIEDKENIMNDKELVELLTIDSVQTVKRISEIKSIILISRMKSMLFAIERTGKVPPHNISATIIERANELKNRSKRNPNSEINRILDAAKKEEEKDTLKETLNTLTSKLENLEKEKQEESTKSQTAMEALLKKVEELTQGKEKSKVNNVKQTTATSDDNNQKKAGRPKNK